MHSKGIYIKRRIGPTVDKTESPYPPSDTGSPGNGQPSHRQHSRDGFMYQQRVSRKITAWDWGEGGTFGSGYGQGNLSAPTAGPRSCDNNLSLLSSIPRLWA